MLDGCIYDVKLELVKLGRSKHVSPRDDGQHVHYFLELLEDLKVSHIGMVAASKEVKHEVHSLILHLPRSLLEQV
jgi:hypothetical protein